jgi:hypothetical protein
MFQPTSRPWKTHLPRNLGKKMGGQKNGWAKKWVGKKMGGQKNGWAKKWVGKKMGRQKNR